MLAQIQANTSNQDMRIMIEMRGAEKSRCQDSVNGQFRPKKEARGRHLSCCDLEKDFHVQTCRMVHYDGINSIVICLE